MRCQPTCAVHLIHLPLALPGKVSVHDPTRLTHTMLRGGRGAMGAVSRASKGVLNHNAAAYVGWQRNCGDGTASTSGSVTGWGGAAPVTRGYAAVAPIPVRASARGHRLQRGRQLRGRTSRALYLTWHSACGGTQTYDEVLERMRSLQLTPTVHTFAILMANYGKAGRFGQVRAQH